jgi:hypothetical protein
LRNFILVLFRVFFGVNRLFIMPVIFRRCNLNIKFAVFLFKEN